MVWFGGIVTDSSFLTSYGTNRCTVYCVSEAFQQQRVLSAVRCHCAAN
jgi:hypothetical protein